MARLKAAPPQISPNAAVQQSFADTYTAAAHKGAMDLSRQSELAGADHYQRAASARNSAVLAGLGNLSQQQQNRFAREQAMQRAAMGQQGGGLLGGLL